MSEEKQRKTQVAVWYFIAATFLSTSTVVFFPDAEGWIRIATIVGALVLIALGGVQLGREITERRR